MTLVLNVFSSATAPSSSEEDVLFSTLTLPGPNGVKKCTECYSDGNDYDNAEETLAIEDLEEESNQSSDGTADDWLPKKESGQTKSAFVADQIWSTISFY